MTSPAPGQSDEARVVLEADEINRALARIAHEVLERNRGTKGLLLLGIKTRGVPLAHRLAALVEQVEGVAVAVGELDITMYRDDLRSNPTRAVGRSHLPTGIDGAHVVLVDDVLFSGRTVLAALDALKDLGRPASVSLAVLVDRGHRELPVQADHIGTTMRTARDEQVRVHLAESDGTDEVVIRRTPSTKEDR